jgi:hypothetical protein
MSCCLKKSVFLLTASMVALTSSAEIPSLETTPAYHNELLYDHSSLGAITDAKVVKGEVRYLSPVSEAVSLASGFFFLINESEIHDFRSEYQLFCSPEFIASIREDYRLLTQQDALQFQNLLFLIDLRGWSTCFFKDGNDWIFVRKQFFDEITAWKVCTDEEGKILSIEYHEELDISIPEDASEEENYNSDDEERDQEGGITETMSQAIRGVLDRKVEFSESSNPLNAPTLGRISDGQVFEFMLSLSEEYEDEEYGTITSTSNQSLTGIYHQGNLGLFDSFIEMLSSPQFRESIREDFRLKGAGDAATFEAFLDETTHYMRSKSMHQFEEPIWYFIRDESFENKEGLAVTVDAEGVILDIQYSHELGAEVEEEAFDESTVDWGFLMTEPHSQTIEVAEGSTIPFRIEFNDTAASRIGAWVMSRWNGSMVSMDAGTEIYSPHSGEIPGEATTLGKHLLEIYLMRPGTDTGTALGSAIIEVSVIPFDDTGVDWAFQMQSPAGTALTTTAGESIPVALTYHASEANRLGAKLEIHYQGKVVGGQAAPNHQSPFETRIPGEVLSHGTHTVDFVLLSPDGKKQLGKSSLHIEAQ